MQRKRNIRERAAFTLMELLLVMAILVIMGGMVTIGFMNVLGNTTMDLAATQIDMFEEACMAYKLKHRQFPNQLEDLTTLPSSMTQRKWGGPFLDEAIPTDSWGNPYDYSKDERMNKVYIKSAGPDGQMNTEDDIPDPNA